MSVFPSLSPAGGRCGHFVPLPVPFLADLVPLYCLVGCRLMWAGVTPSSPRQSTHHPFPVGHIWSWSPFKKLLLTETLQEMKVFPHHVLFPLPVNTSPLAEWSPYTPDSCYYSHCALTPNHTSRADQLQVSPLWNWPTIHSWICSAC